MRVLITGAHGQVGLFITHKFKQAGWQVYATSHSELNICNEDAVRKTIFAIRPLFVVNAAAYTAVEQAEKEPVLAHQINAVAPGYLSGAAAEVGAVIVHISTDYVFDGNKQGTYVERDRSHPLSVYGASKLAGELKVMTNNPHHIILRTSWVFSEYGTNFAEKILRLARERDELNIVTDQFGGPTYAGDVADALVNLTSKVANTPDFSEWGIFHYCGMPYVSWYLFAKAIFVRSFQLGIISIFPEIKGISSAEYPSLTVRPRNSTLNCSKIKAVFSISQPDWQQSLDAMLVSFQYRNLSL